MNQDFNCIQSYGVVYKHKSLNWGKLKFWAKGKAMARPCRPYTTLRTLVDKESATSKLQRRKNTRRIKLECGIKWWWITLFNSKAYLVREKKISVSLITSIPCGPLLSLSLQRLSALPPLIPVNKIGKVYLQVPSYDESIPRMLNRKWNP